MESRLRRASRARISIVVVLRTALLIWILRATGLPAQANPWWEGHDGDRARNGAAAVVGKEKYGKNERDKKIGGKKKQRAKTVAVVKQ